MELRISQPILDRFPAVRLGVVVAEQVDNTRESAAVTAALAGACERLRALGPPEAVLEHPHLAAWREVHRAFGSNPRRFRPSVEALARRVLSGKGLPRLSDVVGACNAASLQYLLPTGGYDLDALEGDVELRLSAGGELFTPLGGQAPEPTAAGEVVYADRARVLTRRWNYRDCEEAKITPASRRVVLLCEAALPAVPDQAVQDCAAFMARLVAASTGAAARTAWLDRAHPSAALGHAGALR